MQWAATLLKQLELTKSAALLQGRWRDKRLQQLDDAVSEREGELRRATIRGDNLQTAIALHELARMDIVEQDVTTSTVPQLASLELLQQRLMLPKLLVGRAYERAALTDSKVWTLKLQLIESEFPHTDALIANRTWAPSLDAHAQRLEQLQAAMHVGAVLVESMLLVADRANAVASAFCAGAPRIPFYHSPWPQRQDPCHNMFSGQQCSFSCVGAMTALAPLYCEGGRFQIERTGCL